jgi:excisionase family DNA binding protein
MQNEILTVTEAADYLKVNEETIRGMIRRGELPAIRAGRIYRIKKQELDALSRPTIVEDKTDG